jgi:hypothetical protein
MARETGRYEQGVTNEERTIREKPLTTSSFGVLRKSLST